MCLALRFGKGRVMACRENGSCFYNIKRDLIWLDMNFFFSRKF